MRTAYALLTLLFTAMLHAAVPVGAVRINTDTTGTNTHSSAITVTGQTNLFAGTLNATNSVNVGRPGEAGLVTVLGTNSVPYAAFDPTNSLTFGTNIFTYGAQNNAVISGLRLTGLGDPVSTGFFLENADSLSFNADAWIDGYAYTVGTTNAHGQMDVKAVTGSGDAEFGVDVLSSAAPRVSVTGLFANKGFTLEPTIADGSTPYTLDTSLAHTSGNLFELKNFSTNVSTLDYKGGGFNGLYTEAFWGGPSAGEIITARDTGNGEGALKVYWYGGNLSNASLRNELLLSLGESEGTLQFIDNVGTTGTYGAEGLNAYGTLVDLQPSRGEGGTPGFTLSTKDAWTTQTTHAFQNHGTNLVSFQPDVASTNTPLTLNINGVQKRVHVGAPDSGGTGLRALTIEN